MEELGASYDRNFDLAVGTSAYARDASNVVASGIPYRGASAGQTDEMEIRTGESTMHAYQNSNYVINNIHPVIRPSAFGSFEFEENMWTDASEAAMDGVSLVNTTGICNSDVTAGVSGEPSYISRGETLGFAARAYNFLQ